MTTIMSFSDSAKRISTADKSATVHNPDSSILFVLVKVIFSVSSVVC